MKKQINILIAGLNIAAYSLLVVLIAYLIWQTINYSSDYAMNILFNVTVIIFLLPLTLFLMPASRVLFYKKSSNLLLIVNIIGLVVFFAVAIYALSMYSSGQY